MGMGIHAHDKYAYMGDIRVWTYGCMGIGYLGWDSSWISIYMQRSDGLGQHMSKLVIISMSKLVIITTSNLVIITMSKFKKLNALASFNVYSDNKLTSCLIEANTNSTL